MAAKVGPATVSYGIGVQNRYSAFLDDDDGFLGPVSIIADSKRISESNKQRAGVATGPSKQPNNQSSHNNNPSGGSGKSCAKSASSNKQSDAKSAHQSDSRRVEPARRSQQQQQKQTGPNNPSSNNSHQLAPKQQQAAHQQGAGCINKYHGSNQNGMAASGGRFPSRASQSNGPNRMANRYQQPGASHNSMNKENNEVNHQQGKFFRQNNPRPIVKRAFNQDDRKVQLPGEDAVGAPIGQSNEEEKRLRQQKRALDMKHKDPEKRVAKRQQSNQTAQSTDEATAADPASSPGNVQGPRGGRGRRQLSDGERATSDELGRNPRGGAAYRNRPRRPEGENGPERRENGGERRENGTRGPRGDRVQRNRNGFGAGSRGSRGDDQGKLVTEKQRPIPNFSDKSDFPSLAS